MDHGRRSSYVSGCRCQDCTDANTVYQAQRLRSNPDAYAKKQAAARVWQKTEKGHASAKAWRDKNRDKLRERENRRRQANRKEYNAKQADSYQKLQKQSVQAAANASRPWTRRDERRLAELLDTPGVSKSEAAKQLGRTYSAVMNRQERWRRTHKPGDGHGTLTGFWDGCRCTECLAARSSAQRDYVAQKNAKTASAAANARRPWSSDEDRRLFTLLQSPDNSIADAAKHLGRSYVAVTRRLARLRSLDPALRAPQPIRTHCSKCGIELTADTGTRSNRNPNRWLPRCRRCRNESARQRDTKRRARRQKRAAARSQNPG